MQSWCQVALAAPIELAPSARTIFGVSTTGQHDLLDIYTTPNGFGIVYLDPDVPVHPLTRETLYYNFYDVLSPTFPTGWTFTDDAQDISDNSLRVRTYDAQGSAASVGADFDVQYIVPLGGRNPFLNMHWIQVVSNNHNITNNPGHGNLGNVVDVANNNTPYYDTGATADNRNLIDDPRRDDVERDHDWIAALFLVSGPDTAGAVTIYDNAGILWGWKNRFFPNPDVGAFHNEVDNLLDDMPLEEYALYHDEFHEELAAIPEPSTALMAIVGFAVGGVWMVYRRNARGGCRRHVRDRCSERMESLSRKLDAAGKVSP